MQASWPRDRVGAELLELLRPLQRRLWGRQIAHLLLRTLCLIFGALLVSAVLAVLGLTPPPNLAVAAVAAALLLLAVAIGLTRRPTLLATARSVDRSAGL